MEDRAESQASQLFHQGCYQEALHLYSVINENLPADIDLRVKVNILLNRSACYLKLRDFPKVLEDCNKLLELEADNSKALSRKSKVLCSLGQFMEAHQLVTDWKNRMPQNDQAVKEYKRLDIIITALNDQDCDDSLESPSLVSSQERVPPDGQEDTTSAKPLATMTTASIVTTTTATTTKTSSTTKNNNDATKAIKSSKDVSKSNKESKPSSRPKQPQKKNHNRSKASKQQNTSKPEKQDSTDKIKMETFYCVQCSVAMESQNDYDKHCLSHPHLLIKANKSPAETNWKFRPPPRGLTNKEYFKCPRFTSIGSCHFGAQCSHAHSEDELAEWCERFELRTLELRQAQNQGIHSAYKQADAVLEKLASTDNPESVIKAHLDGINVHISSEQKIQLSIKKATHSWMFTLTTRVSLKHAILLDDTNGKYFHISSITVGPKRQQKSQVVEADCQEWTNLNYAEGKSANEKVYRVKVLFNTEIYGTFRQSVVFDFGDEPVLCRELCIDTAPIVDIQRLTEILILQEGGRWDLTKIQVVEIQPKPMQHGEEELQILEKYPAPIATQFVISPSLLDLSLTKVNYKERMHCLLDMEEMAQFSSIAKFNIQTIMHLVDRFLLMPSSLSTAKFAHNGELFAHMKLNGDVSEDTAHGRLILQNVSTVYLAPVKAGEKNDKTPNKVYEAVVEDKGKNFIFIRLSSQCVSDWNLQKDSTFVTQVQFHLNRLPICQMHMALDNLKHEEIVFPSILVHADIPWTPQKLWREHLDSRLNAKQKEAIVAITTDISIKLPPILIVGPYGTGKTFTLAQATKEILCQENTRVLICTHSNSAADLYIKDYLHPYVEENHPEATPIRVYYKHRWLQTVHPVILPYCLIGATEELNGVVPSYGAVFRHPTLNDLKKVRVVVSTHGSSQYIYHKDMEPDFFTHVLLDEAAQAMECESLLPLGFVGPNTRVVLAGDHMQMSPEIHSEFARDRDFHVSLLERLYDMYPDQHPCKILLCENYRSHKAIIDFTSELFYDNKLVASGNQPRHESFFPLTFFSARGEEVQHQNSTTFYNNAEVYETVECIGELIKSWPKKWGDIEETSIGVVSPYSDQVQRIRSELRKRKMYSISVERVLNVQGKQFRAILLSTVRTRHSCSTDSSLEDVMDYGFLSNAKLLNTAITRAQSLVAVVGDPISLSSIGKCRKIWERFLEVCNDNGSFHGMTWTHLRAQLDGVELKKSNSLNPFAPVFVPNRLRHGSMAPPQPIAYGKYGYMFTPRPPMPGGVHVGVGPPHWPRQIIIPPPAAQVSPKMVANAPMLAQMGPMPLYHGFSGRPPPPVPHFPPSGVKSLSPLVGTPLPSSPVHASSPGTSSTASPVPVFCRTPVDSNPSGHDLSSSQPMLTSSLSPITVAIRPPSSPGVILSSGSMTVISPHSQSHTHPATSLLTGVQLQKLAPAGNILKTSVTGSPRMMPNIVQGSNGSPMIVQPSMAEVRPYRVVPQQQQAMFCVNNPHVPHMYTQSMPVQQGMYTVQPAQPGWGVVPRAPVGPVYSQYAVKATHPRQMISMPSMPQYQTVSAPHIGSTPGHSTMYTHPVQPHSPAHRFPVPHATALGVVPQSDVQIPHQLSREVNVDLCKEDKLNSDAGSTKLDSVLSSKGTAFFQNFWLQQELYSYMVQTEGKDAANKFIHQMQQMKTADGQFENSTMAEGDPPNSMDIDDSSIIAISQRPDIVKTIPSMRNGHRSSMLDDRTQSPLEIMLHEQQQQIIESAYRSTVPQATQFSGPYSLQKKLDEQAKRAADNAEKEIHVEAKDHSIHSPANSDTTESEDPLEDTYMVANSVVKFLEDSLDEQPLREELSVVQSSLESELLALSSRPRPLYMRGQTSTGMVTNESLDSPTGAMTYAGALRKTSTLSETPSPELLNRHSSNLPRNTNIYDPFGVFTQGPQSMSTVRSTQLPPSADPLDVLRNLNIKASPSTQALFDYFA